jgi:hypothetical protein
MDHFYELMKVVLPAAVVFVAVFLVLRTFMENDDKRREHELRRNTQSTLVPLKLQAYERIVIFLERIHPNTIVVRLNKHGNTAQQLQLELIKTIRGEYEHNLSQQIYVSHNTWELVKNAKEEITKLINVSASKVPPDATSNDLAMMVINVASNLGKKLPNEVALEFVKKEVAHLF